MSSDSENDTDTLDNFSNDDTSRSPSQQGGTRKVAPEEDKRRRPAGRKKEKMKAKPKPRAKPAPKYYAVASRKPRNAVEAA